MTPSTVRMIMLGFFMLVTLPPITQLVVRFQRVDRIDPLERRLQSVQIDSLLD